MRELTLGNMQVVVVDSGPHVAVLFAGESDSLDPSASIEGLVPTVAEVSRGRPVMLDYGQLAYMNSATVTPMMRLIERLSRTVESVRVRYREDLPWQATSFRALRVVAKKWTNVSVIAS